jgi:hypothetical protein
MRWSLLLALALLTGPTIARAQERGGWFTGGVPTFGGLWVWTDVVIYDDWRVQQHALTGHYRLIDPRERRHAWGDLDECLARLDELKVERKLKPGPKDVVIVVHGLGANRAIMGGF